MGGALTGGPARDADDQVARLVDDLYAGCGLDYRGWVPAVLGARLRALATAEGQADVGALRARVLDDARCRERLILALAPLGDGPFPDVAFARALRREVAPRLRTYPSSRVWHAGCASGEEAYTTAIVLREEGLAGRCQIYATDHADVLLERARAGVTASSWDAAAARYREAGGAAVLAEYYQRDGVRLIARPVLREQITFAIHGLQSDASFNEFQLVVCRGVLRPLLPSVRRRALQVIADSLCRFGYLALGPGEGVRAELPPELEPASGARDLYRRVR